MDSLHMDGRTKRIVIEPEAWPSARSAGKVVTDDPYGLMTCHDLLGKAVIALQALIGPGELTFAPGLSLASTLTPCDGRGRAPAAPGA